MRFANLEIVDFAIINVPPDRRTAAPHVVIGTRLSLVDPGMRSHSMVSAFIGDGGARLSIADIKIVPRSAPGVRGLRAGHDWPRPPRLPVPLGEASR
jgi:hypothetical protein